MTARLRDVTANMLISQPSVSRLVDRMAARGLSRSAPTPRTGAGALVRATEAGAAAFRKVASAHGRAIAERMSLLSDDELAQLRDLTAKLRTKQRELLSPIRVEPARYGVRRRSVSDARTSEPTANATTTSSGRHTSQPSSPAVTALIVSIA